MPKLPRETSPKKSSRIGRGEFKSAYGIDDETVEKRYDRPNTESYLKRRDILSTAYLKGEFYLGKIMKLLYPDNVASVHLASTEGETPHTINEMVPHELEKDDFKTMDRFSREFFDLIEIDGGPTNYRKDDEGNIKFIDSFEPWDRNEGELLRKLYNEEKIRKIINEKLTGPQRNRALRYLERVNELFESVS